MAEQASEAAILFADVSGSTKFYETAGNAVAHAAVESCVNIMRQKTQAAKGRVIDLSEAAANMIDLTSRGLAPVDLEVLTMPERAARR